MNKNKIIFAVLGMILFIIVVIIALNLNASSDPKKQTAKPGDFSIWIYEDDAGKFQEFLTQFKTDLWKYQNKNIVVESFSDYETYQNTLSSAFLQWVGPDIFVLNNNEISSLENQTQGIAPDFISPNDFRKVYGGVFGDDLIQVLEEDSTVEFLKGIPLGYETLGIFFNRRYFKSWDFNSWTALNSSIDSVTSKNSKITPIGMGNGGVMFSPDIMMQIFLSLWSDGVIDLSSNQIKQGLQTYLSFGDRRGENAYNSLTERDSLKTNIDYFSEWDVVAVAGYPRMLQDIKNKGYKKNFLLATPFPQYASEEKTSLLNYNYFVVNKDSENATLTNDLLTYMVSEDGVKSYLKVFPYYLPALAQVEDDILEKKIDPEFNIVYKDFINREATLSSFDSGSRVMFENISISTLNAEDNSDTLFEKEKTKIVCSTNKSLNLTNLSSSCE